MLKLFLWLFFLKKGSKMNEITFNELPQAVAEINRKLDYLLSCIQRQKDRPELMTLDQLREFLPEHPARQTVYGWINYRRIPYIKQGKRVYFKRQDIETWLKNNRQWK